MGTDPVRPNRQSTRLRGFDYAGGAYFVTICTHGRANVLGSIVAGEFAPNPVGDIVETTWRGLPSRFPSIALDAFVVMPNHIHGIVFLGGGEPQHPIHGSTGKGVGTGGAGTGGASPTPTNGGTVVVVAEPTLGDVIGAFKSISTIACTRALGRSGAPFWQRSYHDHIIREERALESIRRYVFANPAGWATDDADPVPG